MTWAQFLNAGCLVIALLGSPAQAILNYPSPLIARLEHLLVDTDGAFRAGVKDAITPCSNYVSGAQTLGRQTSAQWLRVAFHDFVTAVVADGTGGLDASIGFETFREENVGSAFNDSFAFFAPYVDSRTSMADMIAVSNALSVGNCGGLQIRLRGGRIDATAPGPPGVPEPQTSLEQTLSEFASSGFSKEDAIMLTACGHSLGHIHHSNFPDVVPASAVTPNNTGGGQNFDSTPTLFDIDVVQEYLSGSGHGGGPLVTTFNETTRSDLRLYESDGNATMRDLSQSRPHFFAKCGDIFERMLNTVPKKVVLSDVVQPIYVKPVNVTFDISKDGDVTLSGYIRVLSPHSAATSSSIKLIVQGTSVTVHALPDQGSNIWGNTTWYPFKSTVSPQRGLPQTLIVDAGTKSTANFPLQSEFFFVPSLSGSSDTVESNTTKKYTITAAASSSVHDWTDVSAVVAYPVPQPLTLAPRIETIKIPLVSAKSPTKDYVLFTGSVELDDSVVQMTSVDVAGVSRAPGRNFVDEYNHFLQ